MGRSSPSTIRSRSVGGLFRGTYPIATTAARSFGVTGFRRVDR